MRTYLMVPSGKTNTRPFRDPSRAPAQNLRSSQDLLESANLLKERPATMRILSLDQLTDETLRRPDLSEWHKAELLSSNLQRFMALSPIGLPNHNPPSGPAPPPQSRATDEDEKPSVPSTSRELSKNQLLEELVTILEEHRAEDDEPTSTHSFPGDNAESRQRPNKRKTSEVSFMKTPKQKEKRIKGRSKRQMEALENLHENMRRERKGEAKRKQLPSSAEKTNYSTDDADDEMADADDPPKQLHWRPHMSREEKGRFRAQAKKAKNVEQSGAGFGYLRKGARIVMRIKKQPKWIIL